MGGCCESLHREAPPAKFFEEEFIVSIQHPTYQNISQLYESFDLPKFNTTYLSHQREQMFYMMINLIRVRPTFFNEQVGKFKGSREMKKRNKHTVIIEEDVDSAIEFLNQCEPKKALSLSEKLCQICQDYQSYYTLENVLKSPHNSTQDSLNDSRLSDDDNFKDLWLQNLLNSNAIEEHVIEFKCWEVLELTAFKEFFEIFTQSVKYNNKLHEDLMSDQYEQIGLNIAYNPITSNASLRIVLLKKSHLLMIKH